MTHYVPARKAQLALGVTLKTLLRWEESGKIKTIRTPNGQRRYDIDSVLLGALKLFFIFSIAATERAQPITV
ncbi:MerR family DNA-binding transcriptional regulator [Nostoc sp. FACHB-280]|uniref:MerR family DNA-binding transcriptional regulator n=1 Tax=Nostoc sp. FACHB-280 TaxID=2692839 RepID=UPI0037C92FA8